MPTQKIKSLPCTFYRGGTSNGLLINSANLPSDRQKWGPILSSAMGSPDVYGRQLNGMGSGISSTSKIMVVSPPGDEARGRGVDLEYMFVQVGIKGGDLDMAGNCGNMSSAVGPFGVDEGLVDLSEKEGLGLKKFGGEVTLRLWNENTNKIINSTFAVRRREAEATASGKDGWMFESCGDYTIDGIPGSGSQITLGFLDPAGAKTGKALPTGNPIDALMLQDGRQIQASLTDIANPGVFVLASEIGVPGDISADELSSNASVMDLLEQIRQAGTAEMGLDPSIQSVPKIVMISPPTEAAKAEGINIVCRALSMQQAHRSVPLTLALNLGVSCRIPGTLAAKAAAGLKSDGKEATLTIAHASGTLEVGSVVTEDGKIESALLHRTARPLMKGEVYHIEES